MKATEIRQMQDADLQERIYQDEEALAKMRFQVATSQLTNTAKIRIMRRDIARMKSISNERKRAAAEK